MLPRIVRKCGKSIARLVPQIDRAFAERDRLREERDRLNHLVHHHGLLAIDAPQFMPPGHFYSPIAAVADVRRDEARIFDRTSDPEAIDLDEHGQLALLEKLLPHYQAMPFPEDRDPDFRYWFANPAYSYSDGTFLHCMIRESKPKRIIEVGSGYSSAMTLDTNERFFENSIRCTFIEPYPELLRSLLKRGDDHHIEIMPLRVQDVPLARFEELEAGDILFIDSTHVAKAGSDVPYLYFHVLPRLKRGVLVHIHDIFVGFEYPQPWVFEGRNWNEIYILRAFLMFNRAFRVLLFNTHLEQRHRAWFERKMPLCLKNEGGSIWLRREVD